MQPQGLRAWGERVLRCSLPAASPDGSDVLAALPAAVMALSDAAAPGGIVFVEDDWQVRLLAWISISCL